MHVPVFGEHAPPTPHWLASSLAGSHGPPRDEEQARVCGLHAKPGPQSASVMQLSAHTPCTQAYPPHEDASAQLGDTAHRPLTAEHAAPTPQGEPRTPFTVSVTEQLFPVRPSQRPASVHAAPAAQPQDVPSSMHEVAQ